MFLKDTSTPAFIAAIFVTFALGSNVWAQEGTNGPILAAPKDISTNLSLNDVLKISTFFNDPANKVKIHYPSHESDLPG